MSASAEEVTNRRDRTRLTGRLRPLPPVSAVLAVGISGALAISWPTRELPVPWIWMLLTTSEREHSVEQHLGSIDGLAEGIGGVSHLGERDDSGDAEQDAPEGAVSAEQDSDFRKGHSQRRGRIVEDEPIAQAADAGAGQEVSPHAEGKQDPATQGPQRVAAVRTPAANVQGESEQRRTGPQAELGAESEARVSRDGAESDELAHGRPALLGDGRGGDGEERSEQKAHTHWTTIGPRRPLFRHFKRYAVTSR